MQKKSELIAPQIPGRTVDVLQSQSLLMLRKVLNSPLLMVMNDPTRLTNLELPHAVRFEITGMKATTFMASRQEHPGS